MSDYHIRSGFSATPGQMQLPEKSQVPGQLSGSGPFTTVVQVPGEVPLHVWQVPQVAETQHTPSMQLPLAHELGPPQDWPFVSLQLPLPSQVLLGGHPSLV